MQLMTSSGHSGALPATRNRPILYSRSFFVLIASIPSPQQTLDLRPTPPCTMYVPNLTGIVAGGLAVAGGLMKRKLPLSPPPPTLPLSLPFSRPALPYFMSKLTFPSLQSHLRLRARLRRGEMPRLRRQRPLLQTFPSHQIHLLRPEMDDRRYDLSYYRGDQGCGE